MRLHWGLGIAATYLAFASATAGFVTFAMQQRVELVRPDYYAHSLTLDAQRRAEARTAALGDRFRLDVDNRGRTIRISWPREQAGRIRGTAWLYRPSDSSADRRIALAPDAAGRQALAVDGQAGRWVVRLEWTVDGDAYSSERDLVAR
jgi:nitrogen fixation protein FixH